jgi:mono/diheme cytochrome c family protein
MRIVVVSVFSVWAASLGIAASSQKRAEPPVEPALVAALMAEGSTLFGSDCAACHAAEGGESVGPPMTSSAALASKDHVIARILEGMPAKGMPPFATSYTDRKVAAVSTFIRGSFENAYGPVVEADVARVRDDLKNGLKPK